MAIVIDLAGNTPYANTYSKYNTIPAGWFKVERNGADPGTRIAVATAGTEDNLSYAAYVTEQLLDILEQEVNIHVSMAFLTITADGCYNVHLLIERDIYHSPRLSAGKVVAEEHIQQYPNISIRYHFTVEREYATYATLAGTQRLKYVHTAVKQPSMY